jgi:hypothetical protein
MQRHSELLGRRGRAGGERGGGWRKHRWAHAKTHLVDRSAAERAEGLGHCTLGRVALDVRQVGEQRLVHTLRVLEGEVAVFEVVHAACEQTGRGSLRERSAGFGWDSGATGGGQGGAGGGKVRCDGQSSARGRNHGARGVWCSLSHARSHRSASRPRSGGRCGTSRATRRSRRWVCRGGSASRPAGRCQRASCRAPCGMRETPRI